MLLFPHQIVFNRQIIEAAAEEGHYGIAGCADNGLASYVEAGIEKCRDSSYLFEFVD